MHNDGALNAFACVTGDLARQATGTAAQEIVAGRHRGPLHGIPLGIKDLYDTAGVVSSSGSRVWAGNIPQTNAAAVERLLDAGMIMVGQTHTHEFAYGAITPTTRNPWNTEHIPGGSSGGSGAAVAARSCMVGHGQRHRWLDPHPRQPVRHGRAEADLRLVSRRGVTSLWWSLDHIGPLTRNVRDCALILNAVAGFDRLDPACVEVAIPDYTAGLDNSIVGLRIGVPQNYFFDHVHQDKPTRLPPTRSGSWRQSEPAELPAGASGAPGGDH